MNTGKVIRFIHSKLITSVICCVNQCESGKIQILMIIKNHMPIKVGMANLHWVVYVLVSNIPARL